MTHPIISILGKLTITIIVITMSILVSVIIIHMSDINNMSDLRTGFMIRPIISIFGMLIIPSLPPPLTLHIHIVKIDIHRVRRRRININIFNPVIQIYYLSLPNVSDPGAGRDPFQDPKDSDILAEAARDDKEEDEEEEL